MWLKYLLLTMSAFVELYCINVFAGALMEKRYKNVWHYFILFAFAVLHSVNSIMFSNTLLIVTATGITLLSVIILFKGKLMIKLIITISFTIIVCLAEAVVAGIMLFFAKFDDLQSAVSTDVTAFAIGVVASKFMLFAITILIYAVLRRKKNLYLDKKDLASIFVLPLATLFVIFILNIVVYQLDDYGTKILFVVASILMYSANIVTFELLFRQSEIIKTKAELEFMKSNIASQEKYYESIFKSQEEIRRLRHDSKNVYTAVLAQIKSGNIDGVEQYLTETIDVLSSGDKIVDTNHPTIDSVIQSKLKICDEKEIKTDFQYFYNEDIAINEIELAVIIGNLLDNAIEANDKVTAPKYIHTLISVDNREINIDMKNPNTEINAKLQTTKANAKNHGFGIKSVSAIAEKYGGAVKFNQENGVFTAYVNLKNLLNHSFSS